MSLTITTRAVTMLATAIILIGGFAKSIEAAPSGGRVAAAAVNHASPRQSGGYVRPTYTEANDVFVPDYSAGTVTVVKGPSPRAPRKPVATITGIDHPMGVAVDVQGDLYVTEFVKGDVLRFSPGTTSPVSVLSDAGHEPFGIAVGPDNTVYVVNGESNANTISVYSGGSTTPTSTITLPVAFLMNVAVDGASNLYVTYGDSNGAFHAGQVAYGTQTLTDLGLPGQPYFLGFDSKGNLVVLDVSGPQIDVFANGSVAPTHTFKVLQYTYAFALPSSGRALFTVGYDPLQQLRYPSGTLQWTNFAFNAHGAAYYPAPPYPAPWTP